MRTTEHVKREGESCNSDRNKEQLLFTARFAKVRNLEKTRDFKYSLRFIMTRQINARTLVLIEEYSRTNSFIINRPYFNS